MKGKASQLALDIMKYIHGKVNYHEVLKEEKCLAASGLVVLPEYRGLKIAIEMLKARLGLIF